MQVNQFQPSNTKHKVVFLGDRNVGKTSILNRIFYDMFVEQQQPTIGVQFFERKIEADNQTIYLQLYDTAGQERYHAINKLYYRDAELIIIVYDITKQESFGQVQFWYNEVKQYCQIMPIIFILGNKVDLIEQEQVKFDDAQAYARSVNATLRLVSAKSNYGIEDALNQVGLQLLKQNDTSTSIYQRRQESIRITQQQQTQQPPQKDSNNQGQQQQNQKYFGQCCQ